MENKQLPAEFEVLNKWFSNYSANKSTCNFLVKVDANQYIAVTKAPGELIEYLIQQHTQELSDVMYVPLTENVSYAFVLGELRVYLTSNTNVDKRLLDKTDAIIHVDDAINSLHFTRLYDQLSEQYSKKQQRGMTLFSLKPGCRNFFRYVSLKSISDVDFLMPDIHFLFSHHGTNDEIGDISASYLRNYRQRHNLFQLHKLTESNAAEILGNGYKYLTDSKAEVFEVIDDVVFWNAAYLLTEKGFYTGKAGSITAAIIPVACKNGRRYVVAIAPARKTAVINVFELTANGHVPAMCNVADAIRTELAS